MNQLVFTSCQAPIAEPDCRAIAAYAAAKLKIAHDFIGNIPWPERERHLDTGQIQVGWICGLPYVWKADQPDPPIELLAAPVMQHPRYQNQPVYFSDVVVHKESEYHTFADLQGAAWAYNEPHSQSGYGITCYQLAKMGQTFRYFGRVVESGAHQQSLQMILDHQIDASAIDSTVLALERHQNPAISRQIRVIDTWGPSPIPPWVISKQVPATLKNGLRAVLLGMHADPHGRTILAAAGMARFARVEDKDYDPIRMMAQLAGLGATP